jgi:hypothetical protein
LIWRAAEDFESFVRFQDCPPESTEKMFSEWYHVTSPNLFLFFQRLTRDMQGSSHLMTNMIVRSGG